MKWASRAFYEELVQHGVNIFEQPPPFVHTKYMVVDDYFALIGSANMDPRSLRLNFEVDLEVYNQPFALELSTHFDNAIKESHLITLNEINKFSIPRKLVDSFAKIFSPYL